MAKHSFFDGRVMLLSGQYVACDYSTQLDGQLLHHLVGLALDPHLLWMHLFAKQKVYTEVRTSQNWSRTQGLFQHLKSCIKSVVQLTLLGSDFLIRSVSGQAIVE